MDDAKGFEVRNEGIEAALREVGNLIRSKIPEGCGFGLMIFQTGEGGDLFWVSNARREDMIAVMKEFIHKNEKPQTHE
jgi:hypothetical protein